MTVNDLKQLEISLEKEELEDKTGNLPSYVYSQLLAVYLYHNDLCNAKLLWKRIPIKTKLGVDSELKDIWNIGKSMWRQNYAGIHLALKAREEWSDDLQPIIDALKDKIRCQALNLVSRAYSSISPKVLGEFLGETAEEALNTAQQQLNWKIDGDMILPVKPVSIEGPTLSCEDQLDKLTEFVAFLEN